ncbi:MAG: right-handed parallel beta-helix repeat-containing protein [Lachnospiraceae bacterium]|nr:right-handed parallel beta-helix repeat-containing protein [Lachnospiraceae bacterium]
MIIYVDVNADFDGNGTKERPFKHINEAAKIAMPSDEVIVAPGVYRENVNPVHAGCEDARIIYRSEKPLGAVITGAETVTEWEQYKGNVYVTRIKNGIFGDYNPYTTVVYGDWYFATPNKHTGCVWMDDQALYEAVTLEECEKGDVYECSWEPEESRLKWYSEQDEEKDETVIYANFGGNDPKDKKTEITVRRQCFMPQEEGIGYITVSGFDINKAATTWAPPAAYQDGMISPHWSKGWIIEDCEIWGSKCAGICVGRYYDPENDHFYTTKHVKSPTQMERDSVCRGQYYGWLKEKIGGHIIRRNNIHHCQQGGIIGRMGGVFSVIEDNHIHHINNMMELGGAEIAGIKMHAAIDVIMRRNHIHHCTMGIWCDWEAQGTRITQNLLHDNQRPEFAKQLSGGMTCQDIFVEVSHGPTLIDNNILLSDVSLRIATQGVAMVHNLCAGSFTFVGAGTTWRYTPYHIPHRTEVMGFMTILHGDDRIYNNIFIQKYSAEDLVLRNDSDPDKTMVENRKVGTYCFDEYPTFDEWILKFDMDEEHPNMAKHEEAHFSHLPVWIDGNAYFKGATGWKKEKNSFSDGSESVYVNVCEKDGGWYLDTNIYDVMKDFKADMISTETLGKAFEPQQRFEASDGTPITFDIDYFGNRRGIGVIPGPFAGGKEAEDKLY